MPTPNAGPGRAGRGRARRPRPGGRGRDHCPDLGFHHRRRQGQALRAGTAGLDPGSTRPTNDLIRHGVGTRGRRQLRRTRVRAYGPDSPRRGALHRLTAQHSTCMPLWAALVRVRASFGSAGINRHREGNERVRHRRSSAPRWPWAMRRRPRGRRRSVGQGYLQAGLLSREISVSGCRRCPNERKATSPAAFYASRRRTPAVREPLHAGNLDAREPGDPTVARPADHGAGRSGKVEAASLR